MLFSEMIDMTRAKVRAFLVLLMLAAASRFLFAGDSLYGKVTSVKDGTLVTLDYGTGHYDIRIAGIEIPPGASSSPGSTPSPAAKTATGLTAKTATGPAAKTATGLTAKTATGPAAKMATGPAPRTKASTARKRHGPPVPMTAKSFVEDLVLGKNARMRLVRRIDSTEMMSQLLTDDPDPKIGIRDVALELLKAGLAVRAAGGDRIYGYKYEELTAAESEARRNARGVWARTPTQTPTPLPPPPAPTPTPTPIRDVIP
jgi:endonuclease YncB( thermonuclease family)